MDAWRKVRRLYWLMTPIGLLGLLLEWSSSTRMVKRRKIHPVVWLLTPIVLLGVMGWLGSTEMVNWDNAVRSDTIASYQEYVRRFPDGLHASEARGRLTIIADVDNKLREVCSGTGAQEAAMYTTSSSFHPVTVYRFDDGQLVNVGGDIPQAWKAGSVTADELVACVGEEKKVVVQTCHYTGGWETTRYRYETSVVLRAARTAAVVAEKTIAGSEPSTCPVSITRGSPFNDRTIEGTSVRFRDIKEWLKGIVNPREGD